MKNKLKDCPCRQCCICAVITIVFTYLIIAGIYLMIHLINANILKNWHWVVIAICIVAFLSIIIVNLILYSKVKCIYNQYISKITRLETALTQRIDNQCNLNRPSNANMYRTIESVVESISNSNLDENKLTKIKEIIESFLKKREDNPTPSK